MAYSEGSRCRCSPMLAIQPFIQCAACTLSCSAAGATMCRQVVAGACPHRQPRRQSMHFLCRCAYYAGITWQHYLLLTMVMRQHDRHIKPTRADMRLAAAGSAPASSCSCAGASHKNWQSHQNWQRGNQRRGGEVTCPLSRYQSILIECHHSAAPYCRRPEYRPRLPGRTHEQFPASLRLRASYVWAGRWPGMPICPLPRSPKAYHAG